MILDISKRLRLNIRLPIKIVKEEKYELTLQLKDSKSYIPILIPRGFVVRQFLLPDFNKLLLLFRKCGFSITEKQLEQTFFYCLPEGIFIVENQKTFELSSAMMARHYPSSEFMFGGRIDWLLTDPEYRGQGLGTLAASLATNHLIKLGYKNIYVTTQLNKKSAIKIFMKLGYKPTDNTIQEYPSFFKLLEKDCNE